MNPCTQLSAKILCALFSVLLLTGATFSTDKDKYQSDIEKRIDNSGKVLDEIMATPDKGIPYKIMSDAKCIAVIPSMVKIAVGFGGNHGKGVATCRTANGRWSALAPITITGGSWGLQARRSGSRSGHDRYERRGHEAYALKQVQDWGRCFSGRRPCWPPCWR